MNNKNVTVVKEIFKDLEGVVNFNSLGVSLILPSQMSNRGQYYKTMGNAMLIEDGESNKTLNIMNKS
jgi:hypothetical protein